MGNECPTLTTHLKEALDYHMQKVKGKEAQTPASLGQLAAGTLQRSSGSIEIRTASTDFKV